MARAPAASAAWNPPRVTGTEMPPNLLLACKLIVVAFVVNGQGRRLPGHFPPFFSALDRGGSPYALPARPPDARVGLLPVGLPPRPPGGVPGRGGRAAPEPGSARGGERRRRDHPARHHLV